MKHSCAKSVVVLHNQQAKQSGLVEKVTRFLQDASLQVLIKSVEEIRNQSPTDDINMAVVLGGDGTILQASIWLESLHIPLLAIHAGTLGFLAEHGVGNWQQAIDDFIHERLELVQHSLLRASLYRDGVVQKQFLAMNEVVLASSSRKLSIYQVQISASESIHMRAEGMVVSMPVGSTGYALAVGGPIIAPNCEVFLVQSIAAFDLSARALVVSQKDTVGITWESSQKHMLLVDGREYLLEGVGHWQMQFELADQTSLWATSTEAEEKIYYRALHDKLGWYTLYPGAKLCCKS